ncbi:MAG: hypothetical protein P4L53_14815 [Candidatus Obscuribacterales bacterium]|nr:hypothetical protein [Candidatus Obscuribacterales bacterium]
MNGIRFTADISNENSSSASRAYDWPIQSKHDALYFPKNADLRYEKVLPEEEEEEEEELFTSYLQIRICF